MAGVAASSVVLLCLGTVAWGASPDEKGAQELDARRLLGTAYYENDEFKPAAEAFRRCVALAPDSAADRFNLGLVLMRAQDYDASLTALEASERLDGGLLGVHYVRGIVYKRQKQYDAAIESLAKVVAGDAQCWGGYYNLGVCYKYVKKFDEAKVAFEAAARISPSHPSSRYQLITLARRGGDVEEAKRHAEIYDRIKDTIDESEKTVEALERSKYSYIIASSRVSKELPPEPDAEVRFTDVTAAAGLEAPSKSAPAPPPERFNRSECDAAKVRDGYVPWIGGAAALGDCDADGDLDVYVVNCASDPASSANRLYRNEGQGRFADVTAAAGVGDGGMGMDAVFGDYDNDGHNDLYVVNHGPNVLYRNRGDGTFEDVSEAARVHEPQFGRQAVFVDYDHDNDLDLLVINDVTLAELPEAEQFSVPGDFPGEVNTLLRNNGNGTFTDQTDEAGLLVDRAQSRAVVFADLDGDADTDLFVCNADAPSPLFANARLGRFATGGSFTPAIERGALAVADGDFNRDGKPDLLVGVGDELYLYTNQGKAAFQGTPVAREGNSKGAVGDIKVFDYNNDGWPDLLVSDAQGQSLSVLAGAGRQRFRDVSAAIGLDKPFGRITHVIAGDVDRDGDEDILLHTCDRGPRLLRNDGGNRRHWIDVRLVGKKVNRNAYGSVVEIAGGGHYLRQTVCDGAVHFGLGSLGGIEVVRVTWPNGVAQNVIRPPVNQDVKVEEYVKVSASCAFLWADNGSRFELVNEILGVAPLGVPMAPGVYHQPDCTELTKIEADQLVARNGMYELRLTEDLREIAYADQITLRVVDHPAELEVVPNEMFTAPPFPEDKLFAVREHRAPRSAVDDRGNDVLPQVLERDGRFPTFPLTHYDGLAEPHSVTVDLGDLAGAEEIMLYLDGWIYWAESSTVMAIAQDPRFALTPLSLQVPDRRGRWRTVIESVGLPTSKGAVVPVDLTGRFLCDDTRVRLSTNLCVYFDRIFVSTANKVARCRVTELPAAYAHLHYRGFSRMERSRLGFERFQYEHVTPFGSWSPPKGDFTRYGDVRPLLDRPDDMYVIFGPGDELTMRFDARSLPSLPKGWVRDFVFYANGWVKDGDLNTALSDTVAPLPFHGMSGYPYPASERYPDTPELRRYLRTYNTRPGLPTVGPLSRQ